MNVNRANRALCLLKPTCADRLRPTPLTITLTTALGDIQAAGKGEPGLAAHLEQGREGVGGMEEARHGVFAGGERPGTRPSCREGSRKGETRKQKSPVGLG